MPQRAKGLGSISLRKDGRFMVTVMVNGKRRCRYAKSRKEAELALARLLTEVQDMAVEPIPVEPPMPTLTAWVETFLAACQTTKRPGTVSTYRQSLKRLLPALGSYPLDKLTPAVLSAYFSRQEPGKRVVQHSYQVLNTCLQMAVDHGYIATNPLAKVAKPTWRYEHPQLWNEAEYKRFVTTALASHLEYAPLFLFLAATGLRISEAIALTWRDISSTAVTVNKSLTNVDGKWYQLPPKTPAGYRQVSLPALAVKALSKQPRNRIHVFYGAKPCDPKTFGNRLRKLCREAGVPAINIHGLRHVHAVMALKTTKDLHAVQRRLGHSSPSITLDIYGYAWTEDTAISSALDKLIEDTPRSS